MKSPKQTQRAYTTIDLVETAFLSDPTDPKYADNLKLVNQLKALECAGLEEDAQIKSKHEARLAEIDAAFNALVAETDAACAVRVQKLNADREQRRLALEAKYKAEDKKAVVKKLVAGCVLAGAIGGAIWGISKVL